MSSLTRNLIPMLASLALLFILIDPTLAHKHDNIKNICSKTDNKDICMDLISTPSASSDDLDYKSIYKIAIKLAYNKAIDMYKYLKNLVKDRSRKNIQGIYDECYKGYAYAAEDLEQTMNYFKQGDYKKIEGQIQVVAQQIRYCKTEIKKKENNEPYLVKTTKEFEILCDVVKYSAKYWKGDN